MSILKYDSNRNPLVDLGKGFKIRLEEEAIVDDKYLLKAKNELRENPETVGEAIFELKELMKGK